MLKVKNEIYDIMKNENNYEALLIYAPAGQSTQMIIGANWGSDKRHLCIANPFLQEIITEAEYTFLALCFRISYR